MSDKSMSQSLLRLDMLLVERGLAPSRTYSQAIIGAGKVRVNGRVIDKSGARFPRDISVEVVSPPHPYVSRGGVKLEHALNYFSLSVEGLTCLDVGASTGGFTDCLLKRGAASVYAVDVGYGQLAWSLRQDPRVHLLERTNIRRMPPGFMLPEVSFVTVDTSFISLKLVIPAILSLVSGRCRILPLVKPQFEVGKGKVGRGGIVRDPALHEQVLSDLSSFFTKDLGLDVKGLTRSPIPGAKGNTEFFFYLERSV